MLDFRLSALEREVQEEFRHFARAVLRPYAAKADEIADLPAPLLCDRSEIIDFMGVYIPEAIGGGWTSRLQAGKKYVPSESAKLRVIISEQLGYGDAALYIALPGPGLAEPPLRLLGNPEQRQRFFAPFLDGIPKWAAFAMSEPGAGSDVVALKTTARKDRGEYVINGTKWFIGNGGRADWLIVFASINPEIGPFGIRSFIVESRAPGFRVGRVLPTLGLKAVQTVELIFEECRIPKENLLGAASYDAKRCGLQAGLQTFHLMRPVVGALAIGTGCAALEYVEELVAQNGARHQAARKWNGVRQVIAEMKTTLAAARLLVWKAAWLYDEGRDNSTMACMAKVLGAKAGSETCIRAMEIEGIAGYSQRSPLEKLFRDVKAFDILEGTRDMQRLMITRGLVRC